MVNPALTYVIRTYGGVVLGWILGLSSTSLLGRWNKRNRVRSMRVAVSKELQELALRLLFIHYRVTSKRGLADREHLEWMLGQIRRYSGPNPHEDMGAVIASGFSDFTRFPEELVV